MHSFQDSTLMTQFAPQFSGSPFLSLDPLTGLYLAWAAVWVALVLGLAVVAVRRKDL